MIIPFYSRFKGVNEQTYIQDCLSASLNSDGYYKTQTLNWLREYYKTPYILLTPSCTAALELSVALLELKPGDEVVIPSFNFPSAANAVLLFGGTPVFCDIEPETQNISLTDMRHKVTPKTRAIIAMDYAGIASIKEQFELPVIEDAAQGMGAFYKQRPLGTLGDFGAISFHYTKNITCGEGGAFLCKNEEDFRKAEMYCLNGTNRAQFLNGSCDRYSWQTKGSCYQLSELNCALLLSQLESLEEITKTRTLLLEQYMEGLIPLSKRYGFSVMSIPDSCTPNGHICYIRFSNQSIASYVRSQLELVGIQALTHYVPLHSSPMGLTLQNQPEDLFESMACYETLLRLPIHTALTKTQVDYIISHLERILLCMN